jgi:hypothetical protein
VKCGLWRGNPLASSAFASYQSEQMASWLAHTSVALRLDAVVDDQNLAARVISSFIDFSGYQPTLFLLVREEIAVGCPQKSTFSRLFFFSSEQQDSKKVRFITLRAILTFIITFITFIIHVVINVVWFSGSIGVFGPFYCLDV